MSARPAANDARRQPGTGEPRRPNVRATTT